MDTVSRIVKNSPMCLHIGHWSLVHARRCTQFLAQKKNKLKRNAPTHSHTHTLAVSWAHCIVHSSEWSISPFCLNHLAMFGAALLCVTIAALAETVTKYDITLVVACTRSAVASLERVIAEQLWCGRSLLKGLC